MRLKHRLLVYVSGGHTTSTRLSISSLNPVSGFARAQLNTVGTRGASLYASNVSNFITASLHTVRCAQRSDTTVQHCCSTANILILLSVILLQVQNWRKQSNPEAIKYETNRKTPPKKGATKLQEWKVVLHYQSSIDIFGFVFLSPFWYRDNTAVRYR